ncbi:hypothetical protein [Streptomyces sp. NPDC006012]|uniref:hypothetical protein n=1 Tax=Streptomyces sp. NPDC006012 TaxID=3364739 RepID=UPI003699C22E
MAPARTGDLQVHGTQQERRGRTHLFVLDERLTGHATFLTATLVLGDATAPCPLQVRILTFDDVTVLSPLPGQELPTARDGQAFTSMLMLPHGWRPPVIPEDFARAAAAAGIDTDAWSEPEARHLLTFLGKARESSPVRVQRIKAIITALSETR